MFFQTILSKLTLDKEKTSNISLVSKGFIDVVISIDLLIFFFWNTLSR